MSQIRKLRNAKSFTLVNTRLDNYKGTHTHAYKHAYMKALTHAYTHVHTHAFALETQVKKLHVKKIIRVAEELSPDETGENIIRRRG